MLVLVLPLDDFGDFVELPLTDSAADFVSSHCPSTTLESLDLRHRLAQAFEGQQYQVTTLEALSSGPGLANPQQQTQVSPDSFSIQSAPLVSQPALSSLLLHFVRVPSLGALHPQV